MFVLASPLPSFKSKAAFFINLVYCIGVLAKAKTTLPKGPACCMDILSALLDC